MTFPVEETRLPAHTGPNSPNGSDGPSEDLGRQLRHTAEDVAPILDFLGAALYVDDPDLFTGFAGWTAGILTAQGVPAAGRLPALDLLTGQLTDFPRAVDMLARGHAAVRDAA